jgi:hypothetical protein
VWKSVLRFLELECEVLTWEPKIQKDVVIDQEAWNNSAPTERNFIKFDISDFFENLSRKIKFRYNPTKITGTLREDVFTFMTISL